MSFQATDIPPALATLRLQLPSAPAADVLANLAARAVKPTSVDLRGSGPIASLA